MFQRLRVVGFVCVAAVAWVAVGPGREARAISTGACGAGREIRVSTRDHVLRLCEAGRAVREFHVALGSGGVGKQQQGDLKTPLGRYPLAAPRASKSFGTFILIGYPTLEQKARGLTGSDVGIHGPPRSLADDAHAVERHELALHDWTAGCIAVETDAEIEAIAAWVRKARAKRVEID